MAAPLLQLTFTRTVRQKCLNFSRLLPQAQKRQYSEWKEDDFGKKINIGETGISKDESHPETPLPGEHEVTPPKGKMYDKKPFPIVLEAGKKYSWCVCGHSKTQPLCDGSHNIVYDTLKKEKPFKFTPHRFTVTEEKKYWLCNCKQTNNRPFCDGTHRRPDIQAKKF